ncbi:MAG: hypothetical protein QXH87_05375, partial [Candidatus Bathyarchaeia archaeon]
FMLTDNVFWMDEAILDPFQIKKRKRVEQIKSMLAKLKEIDLKKFLAKVSINCGIEEMTVRKYLESLKIDGCIEIKDGKILWKDKAEST